MTRIVSFAAAVLVCGLSAAANETQGNEWRTATTSDDGDVVMIVSGSENERGTFFSCAGDKLSVGVATEAGNIVEMLSKQTSRSNDREISLSIGDGEPHQSRWTYLPSIKIAVANDELTAKKLYNSAIKGDAVSWKMPGRQAMDVSFPSLNETFTSFANDCSVTKPAK